VVPEIVLGESGGEVTGRTVGMAGDEVADEESCCMEGGGERAPWLGGVEEDWLFVDEGWSFFLERDQNDIFQGRKRVKGALIGVIKRV